MFPFIMIVSALIFFSPKFHNKIISKLRRLLFVKSSNLKELNLKSSNYALVIVILFLIIQTLLPLRHILYPGSCFGMRRVIDFHGEDANGKAGIFNF